MRDIIFQKKIAAPFVLVIPVRNAEKYIKTCLNSIEDQTFSAWHAIVIDDQSTDKTADFAKEFILQADPKKYTLIKNQQRLFALQNVSFAIRSLVTNDKSIIGIIDGDDWFCSEQALEIMWDAFAGPYDLIWSQHKVYPTNRTGYSSNAFQSAPRCNRRGISHFKTFRKSIFDLIPEDEFKDEQGNYFRFTYDKAITYPMSEIAKGILFIDKPLYSYNCENQKNVAKGNFAEQLAIAEYLESRPRLILS